MKIESTFEHKTYNINTNPTTISTKTEISSNFTSNKIEELPLDITTRARHDINVRNVYTNDDDVEVLQNEEDGSYILSITTSDNRKIDYELYDQGRGIGISNETCIKSTQSCIKEKMPDSEFEEIKDKIISDCKSSGLSPERLALLEKLLNDEVFLTALNDFSIGNGCGTYSLLEVLNGYYNLNINEVEFFTSFLIKNLHNEDEGINDGFDAWLKIVYGKINDEYDGLKNPKPDGLNLDVDGFYNDIQAFLEANSFPPDYLQKLEESDVGGPLTVSAMSKVLNNLEYNNEILLGYDKTDFAEGGEYYNKMQEQLKSGKPVVLMVRSYDKTIAEFPGEFNDDNGYQGEFIPDNGYFDYVKTIKNKDGNIQYQSMTNSFHFLTVVNMDDNGYVYIADSRYLPDGNNSNLKYSHVLKMEYNYFASFISNSSFEGEYSNTFGPEHSGMLFVDN